jgi:hypothetical protein
MDWILATFAAEPVQKGSDEKGKIAIGLSLGPTTFAYAMID